MGDRRSTVGFESTDLGERSMEWRGFWVGEGELGSDLSDPALPTLETLGVAGLSLLLEASDKPDLFKPK